MPILRFYFSLKPEHCCANSGRSGDWRGRFQLKISWLAFYSLSNLVFYNLSFLFVFHSMNHSMLLAPSSLILPFPTSLPPHQLLVQPPPPPFVSIPSVPSFPSNSLRLRHSSPILAALPSDEDDDLINFEEKDWSFLDSHDFHSHQNISRIITSGGIKEASRVLVSTASEGFVDGLVHTSPCTFLLLVHDSLYLLAAIKAKYDEVKCWQGELIHVPQNWLPLDVLFLYFLPALPFKLHQLFGTLAKYCAPGARLVVSHPQGRKVLEQQRKQYPDVVISDLPDEITLQKVAADHSFKMVEFVDEPGFYLAVLQFPWARN